MKLLIKTVSYLLCAAIATAMATSCNSYERKIARFEKVANEYKASLGPNCQIIAERIDSVAQKLFYIITDAESQQTDLMIHDYSTSETKSLLPHSQQLEDYEFCLIKYKEAKLIDDRLFIIIQSSCMLPWSAIGIFYVNIRDNTLHYVESCDNAIFDGLNRLLINKVYYLGEQEYDGDKLETKEYYLSTSLSDKEYSDNRQKQRETEECLAEEWRKREEEKRLAEERRRQGVEKTIKIDFIFRRDWGRVDNAGTLQGTRGNSVYTKTIIVPYGKEWQLKNITYSGCSESNPPRFYGCMNAGGAFDDDLFELKNGQTINSGGYTFWMMFDKHPNGEHITADIVFREKEIGY